VSKLDITLDDAQSIAELMRAVQGKKTVHYLEHGKNPARELNTGQALRFVDGTGHTPHKDARMSALHIEFQWHDDLHQRGTVPLTELVSAVECGRFYIDGDLSHQS
jgi:hypothetical protein